MTSAYAKGLCSAGDRTALACSDVDRSLAQCRFLVELTRDLIRDLDPRRGPRLVVERPDGCVVNRRASAHARPRDRAGPPLARLGLYVLPRPKRRAASGVPARTARGATARASGA